MCKTFQKQRKFPVNNVDVLLVFLVSRCYIYGSYPLPKFQVTMVNKKKSKKGFSDLGSEDLDLTMFTITDLTLNKEEEANMVFMAIKLKRKVVTELVTTYLPTILLLLITFTTIFFEKGLFADAIAVNLTIMLVMTTIFTSKIEELPPTSDMKMIDIWLISCLVIPFLEVILRTTIECLHCGCNICEVKGVKKSNADGENKEKGERDVVRVLAGVGGKVAPQQVTIGLSKHIRHNLPLEYSFPRH